MQYAHHLRHGLLRVIHLEVTHRAHRKIEVFRMDVVLTHHPVLQFTHHRGGTETHLIHAVAAEHHHSALGAEIPQHAHADAHKVLMENAKHLAARVCWIRERSQNIEDRSDSEFLADRGRVLHGGVVERRKHESHMGFFNALRDLLWLQHDVRADCLQGIRGTGLRGDRTAAMLRHAAAGRGNHEHRGC